MPDDSFELCELAEKLAAHSLALKKIHIEVYDTLQSSSKKIDDGELEDSDLVDVYIIYREIEQFSDLLRKEARRGKIGSATRFCKSVAVKVFTALQSGKSTDDKIEGTLGSARPKVQETMVMPESGSPESIAMLRELEVPEQSIERGLIKPSFGGIRDHLTQLASEGKKLPDFAKFTFKEYDMKATVKRNTRDKHF